MAEEIAFENGQISNFEGLVTLTLDRVILHTVVHHSSTSTYMPNFIEIKETFCGRTDGHLRPALLGWLCRRVDLKWPRSSARCTHYSFPHSLRLQNDHAFGAAVQHGNWWHGNRHRKASIAVKTCRVGWQTHRIQWWDELDENLIN